MQMQAKSGESYEERLRIRIGRGGPDAVGAALALMERHDPASFEQALGLALHGAEPPPQSREVVAEAWDRYFHIRSMPWE
jgi:hypothetical protein